MPDKRCPCDDCSGVDNCPLRIIREKIDAIREAAKAVHEYPFSETNHGSLDGAIQDAYDAMEG